MGDKDLSVTINRAPVLTLWAAVVAERLGLDRDEALTVGRALSGLTAHAKGVRLGIFEPSPEHVAQHRQSLKPGDTTEIRLMGRDVEAIHTPEGLRAVSRGKPIKPAAVRNTLPASLATRWVTFREPWRRWRHPCRRRNWRDRPSGFMRSSDRL